MFQAESCLKSTYVVCNHLKSYESLYVVDISLHESPNCKFKLTVMVVMVSPKLKISSTVLFINYVIIINVQAKFVLFRFALP